MLRLVVIGILVGFVSQLAALVALVRATFDTLRERLLRGW